MELRLRVSFADAECFFPDCLESLKVVDIVGTDDDYSFILVAAHRVEINSYVLQDRKAPEIQEALSLHGEVILLPSAELDNAWERLEIAYICLYTSNLVSGLYSIRK